MVPSAVFSTFPSNRSGSYSSSTNPYDHTSLPPLQISTPSLRVSGSSAPPADKYASPGFRIPYFSDSPTDDSAVSRLTALPNFPAEWHQHRPSSATLERPGLAVTGTISAVASRAHNFVFSLQPPKKFSASLTPNDSPISSTTTGPMQLYNARANSKNASTSSLSVAEDAVSHRNGASRVGKGRFHLLNPMSLLARRRSSQNHLPKVEEGSLNVQTPSVPNLPDDYDPRIRGKFIHDFSIPKARRFNSYNSISSPETSPSIDSRPSTQGNRRASEQLPPFGPLPGRNPQSPVHSPLFREHFNDDGQTLQPQSTGYLHALASFPTTQIANDPPRLPAFAKSLPLDIFGGEYHVEEDVAPVTVDSIASSVLPPDTTQSSPARLPSVNGPPSTLSPSLSVAPIERTQSPTADLLRPLESLPKHMTSTSSRFSFQLGGIGSEAQERLLEEKHKQHVAFKMSHVDNREDVDSEEDRYADIDFDDDDGLEEKIPGVNADMDDDDGFEERIPGVNADMEDDDRVEEKILSVNAASEEGHLHQSSFHFTPLPAELSPVGFLTGSQPTPRDIEGQVIGIANTRASPDPSAVPSSLELERKVVLEQLPWLGGLGITSLESASSPGWTESTQRLAPQPQDLEQDLDDLYFDDGNFKDLDDMTDRESFDEDIFDDDSGKIHDIPAQNARRLEIAQQKSLLQLSEPGSFPHPQITVDAGESCERPLCFASTDPEESKHAVVEEDQQKDVDVSAHDQGNGLTEDNLAYQNALVSAANMAAAQGRFARHLSMSQDSEDFNAKSQLTESQPGLISDDSRISRLFDSAVAEDEPDDFPVDDSLEDDLMIAEANAEVLENDDDGFYGQEFGFYARAHGKGNAELVNGGYFGAGGVEGVHRSHSAKANFQEPSLTPITERSEWSHRNSIASVHTLGLPPTTQAIPSPGIAQLLDLDPSSFEDEMSLSALLKLRRGAWGGSQTSLNSTGASQAGSSPLAHPPLRESFGSQQTGVPTLSLNTSDLPRHSYDPTAILPQVCEEERIRPSSNATETQNTPRQKLPDVGLQSAIADALPYSSGLSRSSHGPEKSAQSHSRASSGAESVSYIKDPEGSGRWLLERRRTGDDGELELVGREYVAGARI